MTNGVHVEEIVWAESEDGYVLEGLKIEPGPGMARQPLPIVVTHGFRGWFCERFLVEIGRRLAARGHVYISGGNRGAHVGVRLFRNDGGDQALAGAWWERFEEAPRDIAGWIAYAIGLGFPRVVLLGHSLGALKVVYYQASRQDERLAGLVSASGPVHFAQRVRDQATLVKAAEPMVANGRGEELLPFGSSNRPSDRPGATLSAQTLLSRARLDLDTFGADGDDPLVAQIRCPFFALIGTEEARVGTPADLDLIRANASNAPRVDTYVVEGGNHTYDGRWDAVADSLASWVATLK